MECKKVGYDSKKLAKESLNWIKRHKHKEKYPVREYWCEYCRKWHLTSNSQGTHKPKPVMLKMARMFKQLIEKQIKDDKSTNTQESNERSK